MCSTIPVVKQYACDIEVFNSIIFNKIKRT